MAGRSSSPAVRHLVPLETGRMLHQGQLRRLAVAAAAAGRHRPQRGLLQERLHLLFELQVRAGRGEARVAPARLAHCSELKHPSWDNGQSRQASRPQGRAAAGAADMAKERKAGGGSWQPAARQPSPGPGACPSFLAWPLSMPSWMKPRLVSENTSGNRPAQQAARRRWFDRRSQQAECPARLRERCRPQQVQAHCRCHRRMAQQPPMPQAGSLPSHLTHWKETWCRRRPPGTSAPPAACTPPSFPAAPAGMVAGGRQVGRGGEGVGQARLRQGPSRPPAVGRRL